MSYGTNTRGVATLLFLSLAIAGASSAHAQILDTYESGYPIQQRFVYVPGNSTVTFRTDTSLTNPPLVTYSDTILTLMHWDGSFLAGADGWDTSSPVCASYGAQPVAPSCFSYTNNSSVGHFAVLVGRSWTSGSPAQTRLYAYGPGQTNGPMGDFSNGGSTAPVFLGGGSFNRTLASSGRQHLTTAHLPGDADRHILLIRHSNNNSHGEEIYWFSRYNVNRSDVVYELAEFDEVGLAGIPTANVGITYGGDGTSNIGPVRMLRNTWFQAGQDVDGDGLGHALEQALGTCDRASDFMPSGRACSDLQFCSSNPTGAVCKAQLRDTDHDGIRDDVEVYGYDDPLAHMARYGADPVHKDIFIEMQTVDRDPASGCQGFDSSVPVNAEEHPRRIGSEPDTSLNFFVRAQEIYDDTPDNEPFFNPDGEPGITLHHDVGVPNPDPTNVAWGDWGGGNTCYMNAGAYASLCAAAVDPDRAWLFRCAIDAPGGGQASGGGWAYRATSSADHVHELGHVLGLGHGSPNGSAASRINASNRRPLAFTRMNYRYSFIDNDNTQGTWAEFSFSDGRQSLPTNARFAQEIEPAPGENLAAMLEGDPPALANENAQPGRWDVDWNQDGLTSGVTVWEAYRDTENGRNARGYKTRDPHAGLELGAYGSHMDAAVVGDVLVYAFTENDNVYFMADSDGECSMVTTAPSPGERHLYDDCLELGARFDTGYTGSAVALANTLHTVPGGGTVEGLIMAYRIGKFIYWREVDVTANPATAWEAGFQFSGGSTTTPIYVGTDDMDISLVEVPATANNPHGGVMMFLQQNGGSLRQLFLPAGSAVWSAPSVVYSSGTALGPVAGDVGAVGHKGLVYTAVRRIGSSDVEIYTMPAGADQTTPWTLIGSFAASTATDIEVGFTPPPTNILPVWPPNDPGPDEFYVLVMKSGTVNNTGGTANIIFQETTRDFANWEDGDSMGQTSREYTFSAPAAVYDARSVATNAHGLRVFRETHRGCNDQSWSCTDWGYHPQTPGSPPLVPAPGGSYGFEYCASDVFCTHVAQNPSTTAWEATVRSYIQYLPFAEGHNPTQYCDYDEWETVDWQMCETLAGRSAPTHTSDFVRTPYQLTPTANEVGNVRCRNRVIFNEPLAGGQCARSYTTTETDRASFPAYYNNP